MKKRLIFIISSLEGGGAEKVLVDIINHLDVDKYVIFLVIFEKKGEHLSDVPEWINIYDLHKKSRYSFFKLIFRLGKLFNKIKPDTVISFMAYTNMVVILAKYFTNSRFNLIINIQTYLKKYLFYARYIKLKYFLYKLLFNKADFIVTPSVGVQKDLEKTFSIKLNKIRVIFNPIDIERIKKLKDDREEIENYKPFILAVGRLTKQKGYPYLLKAYSIVNKKIDEKILILGTGEDEKKLKILAKNLKIENNVFFLGFKKNPYKFMKNASIFVLSSLWEGFAVVLAEAMACGTTVISTDCLSGPGEIITNGKNGILVPPADERELAKAMLTLLKDENLRKKFSEEGRKRSEDFRIEKILPQYEQLF